MQPLEAFDLFYFVPRKVELLRTGTDAHMQEEVGERGRGRVGEAGRRETLTCARVRACRGGSPTAINGRGLYREVHAVLQIFDRADVHAA